MTGARWLMGNWLRQALKRKLRISMLNSIKMAVRTGISGSTTERL
jgi:hypothetical protein